MDCIEIYTDGSSRGNPGKGGYGIVMKYKTSRKELAAAYKHTTNNRMELLAVIVALESIKNYEIPVRLYSDSSYVIDAITKKWVWNWVRLQFKNKKNKDLWVRFLAVHAKVKHIHYIWVKGHASNAENNRCDELATVAADNGPWLDDWGYMQDENNLF